MSGEFHEQYVRDLQASLEEAKKTIAELKAARDEACEAWERFNEERQRHDPHFPAYEYVKQRIAAAREAGVAYRDASSEEQCSDCGEVILGSHGHCSGVPGGFGDD